MAVSAPRPHALLSAHARAFPRAGAVLDLHARDGDDALYLAQRGYAVEAVVEDPQARAGLARRAQELDVRVDILGEDPRTMVPLRGQYAAVLGIELWPTLSPTDAEALMARVPSWVGVGGLVLLSSAGDGGVAPSWQPQQFAELFWGFEVHVGAESLVFQRSR
jgi:hypothetical protein